MIFSHLARLLAYAAFVFGLLVFLSAIWTKWGPDDEIARLGIPVGAIDLGIYATLFAVAMGTLAEISFSTRKLSSN